MPQHEQLDVLDAVDRPGRASQAQIRANIR
jgi:hypothetical protein